MEARGALAREAQAARRAWPLIDRGLGAPRAGRGASGATSSKTLHRGRARGGVRAGAHVRARGARARGATEPASGHREPSREIAARNAAIGAAVARARSLRLSLVPESQALTGAAAGLAGVYELAAALVAHSWPEIDAAANAARHGPRAAAFLRANANTYIIAVYDGHFDLSLIGKGLRRAYRRLGGPDAFGASLTAAQVRAIAAAYSPRSVRLRPHPWQSLVSG
jgi:hypothetical protein